MNHYIRHIIEAFDFNTVKNNNKSQPLTKTAMDAAIEYVNNIVNKILNEIKLTDDEIYTLYSNLGIYKVKDEIELKKLIDCCIEILGNECNLNWIDVSNVTNMNSMFSNHVFNGVISKWNVSNVTDMAYMFYRSQFIRDISQWNVSNVTDMDGMFYESEFNGDISQWDVSNVKTHKSIFDSCPIKRCYKPKFK